MGNLIMFALFAGIANAAAFGLSIRLDGNQRFAPYIMDMVLIGWIGFGVYSEKKNNGRDWRDWTLYPVIAFLAGFLPAFWIIKR